MLYKELVISERKDFIIESANENPEVINYIAPKLKSDDSFVQELYNTNDGNLKKAIASNCSIQVLVANNPELSLDESFMTEAIKTDVSNIEFASDDLKNNEEFMKQQVLNNNNVIEYVINNTDKFDLKGVKGAKEGSREKTIDSLMDIISELAETSEDKRYKQVKKTINEKGKDNVCAIRWAASMCAQGDDIDVEILKKVVNYVLLSAETIKKDLTEDGKEKVTKDNILGLVTPHILFKIKEKIEKGGSELDSSLIEKLEKYQQFYDIYHEKFNEMKRRNRGEEIKQIAYTSEAKDVVEASNIIRDMVETHKEVPMQIEDSQMEKNN